MQLFSVNFFDVKDTPIKAKYTIIHDDGAIFDNTSEDTQRTNFNLVGKKQDLEIDDINELIKNETGDEKINYTSFTTGYDEIKEGTYSKDNRFYDYHEYYKTINDTKYMLVLKNYSDTDGGRYTFYKGTDYNLNVLDEEIEVDNGEKHPIAYDLKRVIATWYKILRTIVAVGMMSVLVYIGIRIVISSTANQKAKYKQLLGDWIVGMVLLFSMHFIMAFSNSFVDSISKLLNNFSSNGYVAIIEDKDGKVSEALTAYGFNVVETQNSKGQTDVYRFENDGKKFIEWKTNLMGLVRMNLARSETTDGTYVGYTLMFLVLIIYTLSFIITYIKRVIYMAFLTLIAPFVALTYPIDKATDNKAQGFSYWFREYIFNLLLQPLHLLLYTILVSSAIKLAVDNWVYAVVAIGFISSAEKILRKMFNFEKAKTPGLLSGSVGAAMTYTGMSKILENYKGKSSGGSAKKNDNKIDEYDDLNGLSNNETDFQDALRKLKTEESDYKEDNISIKNSTDVNSSSDDYSQLSGNTGNSDDFEGYDSEEFDLNSLWSDDDLWREMVSNADDWQYRKLMNMNPMQRKKAVDQYRKIKLGNNNKIKIKLSRKWRAGKDALDFYKDNFVNKFKREIKNSHPIHNLARMSAGAISAAIFGTIGLASGIASGELEKVFQNASLGIAGGYKFGDNLANRFSSNFNNLSETAKQYVLSSIGEDEYRKLIIDQNQSKFINDEENIYKVSNKKNLSRRDAKTWLKVNAKKYLNEGITNIDDIIDIQKMVDDRAKFKYYDDETDKVVTGRIDNQDNGIAAFKVLKMFHTDRAYGFKKRDEIVNKMMDMGLTRKEALTAFYASDLLNDYKNDTVTSNVQIRGRRKRNIIHFGDPVNAEVSSSSEKNMKENNKAKNTEEKEDSKILHPNNRLNVTFGEQDSNDKDETDSIRSEELDDNKSKKSQRTSKKEVKDEVNNVIRTYEIDESIFDDILNPESNDDEI